MNKDDIYFLMETIRVIKNNPEILSKLYIYLYEQLSPEDQVIVKEKLDKVSTERFI